MGKMKELRQDVFEFLTQLKEDGKYDRFTAPEVVRKEFKLTRHQTAQLVQEFNEKH